MISAEEAFMVYCKKAERKKKHRQELDVARENFDKDIMSAVKKGRDCVTYASGSVPVALLREAKEAGYTVILGNNALGDLYYIISCDPERKNKLKPSESLY